jgi:hypothetical protein
MSRYEINSYANALQQLKALRDQNSMNAVFFQCSNLAWDWMSRPSNQWFTFPNNIPVWDGPTGRQQSFYELLWVVVNDFEVVISIVHRLEWLRKRLVADADFLSPNETALHLLADVHAFHMEFRSLLDSLCHVINIASAKPGQVSTDSFNSLRKWCIQHSDRSSRVLTAEISDLIAESYWFMELRNLRNKVAHQQADACVRFWYQPYEIVFFTAKGKQTELYEGPNAFQYNNWIFFRPHAGYYLGRLLFLLNAICSMAVTRLKINLNVMRWSSSAIPAFMECVDYAIDSLELGFPAANLRASYNWNTIEQTASQHEKIARRAYYLSRHRQHSSNYDTLSDWLLAEKQQLRALD